MNIAESVGLGFIVFVSALGVRALAYLAVIGYRQVRKELNLGQGVVRDADAVMRDIQAPVVGRR